MLFLLRFLQHCESDIPSGNITFLPSLFAFTVLKHFLGSVSLLRGSQEEAVIVVRYTYLDYFSSFFSPLRMLPFFNPPEFQYRLIILKL